MAKKETPSKGAKKDRPDAVRGADGRFLPGNKTGGRTRMPEELVEMCRALSPQAIETAKKIMLDKEARAGDRLRAAEIILDRGYGKPQQAVNLEVEKVAPVIFIGADEVAE